MKADQSNTTPQACLDAVRLFIARMPSLSTTMTKVLEISNDPAASPSDLNRVIALDPVLTGSVLKLINSAYYSLPDRTVSLTRAIIMLGINTVKNLVMAVSVLAVVQGRSGGKTVFMDDFWAHCLAVGVIGKTIARRQQVPAQDVEAFFVAGLLHDLGKFPLMVCFPDRYAQAIQTAQQAQIGLFEAEQQLFGTDHGRVGRMIADKWRLDESLAHVIGGHHLPESDAGQTTLLLDIIRLANAAAYCFGIGSAGDGQLDPTRLQGLAQRCGVDAAYLLGMQPAIVTEIEKARVFLHMAE